MNDIIENTDKKFGLERIYIKEKSFKAKNMPAIFQLEWKPEICMEIQIKNEKIKLPAPSKVDKSMQASLKINSNDQALTDKATAATYDNYEVTLEININAKQNGITILTIYIQQAGIFLMQGLTEEEKKFVFSAHAPNILFPYARKIISDMTVEASLPPILLAPIDFIGVHQDQMRKKRLKESTGNISDLN